MPSLTIKNIPDKVYKKLKLKAERNKRSLNSEILTCLESAVEYRKIDSDELIKKARMRRSGIEYVIKDEEVTKLKQSGRL
ncbi:MAG: FitA-like ribbon-helix-helix domain-containing protein [Ignavibacteria bacterium]